MQPANSPPLSLPQERGTGTRCATPENSWGTSSRPAPPPFLPRPPPRPVRPLPACPATPRPAGPLRAAGRLGWRAGGRAVDGALPGPGHGAPDLGATPSGEAREGRRGSRRRRGAGRGGGRSRRSPRSQGAAPRRGLCCPAAHLGVRSSGLPRAGGGVLLRVSRFLRSLSPPRGLWAQLLPPRPPGPAAVTLAAPAQRPPSAHPAPSALQCDPWRLGGPLAPKLLLTTQRMLQHSNGAAPKVQGRVLDRQAMQALGRALKAWAATPRWLPLLPGLGHMVVPSRLSRSSQFSFLKMTKALERGRGKTRNVGCEVS